MGKINYLPKPLFLERMQKLFPDKKDFENYMEILKQEPVRSIRCNTLKISPENLKRRLEKKGWKIKQPFKEFPEIFIIEGKYIRSFQSLTNKNKSTNTNSQEDLALTKFSRKIVRNADLEPYKSSSISESNLMNLEPGELGRALEHLLGYYYVQEIASMLPVLILKPKPNETILDLCSAPGSKTTQIASEMKNTGLIIANEIKLGRVKILATNLQRCGVMNVIITKKDGWFLCDKLKKENFLFDKILIDAPCSGEGTIRSSPKTNLMWNIRKIKSLSGLQKNLVSAAIKVLKLRGELIYSTCTHAPEENEEVADYILKKFPEMKLEEIKLPLKIRQGIIKWENREYSKEIKKCARIYPQDNNTEGFFIAKFRKIK